MDTVQVEEHLVRARIPVDYATVWEYCIHEEDALIFFLSHDVFNNNSDNNKELYKSNNKYCFYVFCEVCVCVCVCVCVSK